MIDFTAKEIGQQMNLGMRVFLDRHSFKKHKDASQIPQIALIMAAKK